MAKTERPKFRVYANISACMSIEIEAENLADAVNRAGSLTLDDFTSEGTFEWENENGPVEIHQVGKS